MSIQSVQSSPILQNFLGPVDLDQEIKKAITAFDMASVKELISKGASGDQRVILDYTSMEKTWGCLKDRAFIQSIIEDIYLDFEDESALTKEVVENFQKLNEWIFEGDPLSKRFVQLFTKVLGERHLLFYTEDELNELGAIKDNVSLLEFAVLARDLELIELLIDSGLTPNTKEFVRASFFGIEFFTETNLSITESLFSRGFSLDDFLVRDETLNKVISEAEENESELLLSFLKKHELLCNKKTMLDLSPVQKV